MDYFAIYAGFELEVVGMIKCYYFDLFCFHFEICWVKSVVSKPILAIIIHNYYQLLPSDESVAVKMSKESPMKLCQFLLSLPIIIDD